MNKVKILERLMGMSIDDIILKVPQFKQTQKEMEKEVERRVAVYKAESEKNYHHSMHTYLEERMEKMEEIVVVALKKCQDVIVNNN